MFNKFISISKYMVAHKLEFWATVGILSAYVIGFLAACLVFFYIFLKVNDMISSKRKRKGLRTVSVKRAGKFEK